MTLPGTIRTPRLCLRPAEWEDVGRLLGVATDPEWARYLPVPQPYRFQDAEAYISGLIQYPSVNHPNWIVELRDEQRRAVSACIGTVDLEISSADRCAVLGYTVARPYWGLGVATEATAGIINAAFRVDSPIDRIEALVDVRNHASIRVLDKLGMRRVQTHLQHRQVRGLPVDDHHYVLHRRDWTHRATEAEAYPRNSSSAKPATGTPTLKRSPARG